MSYVSQIVLCFKKRQSVGCSIKNIILGAKNKPKKDFL